tara:strand:+ start:4170 stop:4490 length:321 start_codon:yes stop_codon:yes gene_type:complete
MATVRRKAKSSQNLIDKTKAIFFSSRGFPIILTFTVLAILFVLFRMKTVELDYQVNYLNKEIEEIVVENKDLKARKAKLMSVDKLRAMAQRHGLSQPKQNQIIVVP